MVSVPRPCLCESGETSRRWPGVAVCVTECAGLPVWARTFVTCSLHGCCHGSLGLASFVLIHSGPPTRIVHFALPVLASSFKGLTAATTLHFPSRSPEQQHDLKRRRRPCGRALIFQRNALACSRALEPAPGPRPRCFT